MTTLTHPVTGHQVRTDDESAGFWAAAGYRPAQKPASARKTAAKKAAAKPEK